MSSIEKLTYDQMDATVAPSTDFFDRDDNYYDVPIDIKSVERQVDTTLKDLRKSTDPVEQGLLIEQLRAPATELAALVLPENVCKELNIIPEILDNQSFYHPPTRDDVLRLAASAEITHDPTISSALVRSIDELPEEVRHAFERALEARNNGDYETFGEALFYTKLDDKDFDSHDFNIAYADSFFDHGGDLDPTVDYNTLDANDPRMERLVSPVATSMRGEHGTRSEPRIEFYVNNGVKTLGRSVTDRTVNIS